MLSSAADVAALWCPWTSSNVGGLNCANACSTGERSARKAIFRYCVVSGGEHSEIISGCDVLCLFTYLTLLPRRGN